MVFERQTKKKKGKKKKKLPATAFQLIKIEKKQTAGDRMSISKSREERRVVWKEEKGLLCYLCQIMLA